MSQLTKAGLETVNQDNFPNNSTGYITPQRLRAFNTDVIDSTVNQTIYTANSASFDSRLDAQEAFSSSIAIDYINQTELNAATASLSASLTTTINGKVSSSTFTTFSTSVDSRLNTLGSTKANLVGGNSFTGSQNVFGNITSTDNIVVAGQLTASVIKTPYITGSEFRSATGTSFFQTLDSTTLSATTLTVGGTPFSSFSASVTSLLNFSASQYKSDSGSFDLRLDNLEYWSGTLDLQFATDAQLNASSSTLQSNIDTKLNTSSFNTFSASVADFSSSQYKADSASFDSRIDILTSSVALTGSNTFTGNQIISGALYVSSSAQNDVVVNGQVFISSSETGTTTQPRLTVSGSGGQTNIFRNQINSTNGTNTAGFSPSAIFATTVATADEIGFSVNPSGSVISGWTIGPSIYVNNTAGDTYRSVFGFQNKANYTDGRVTVLTPLLVSSSTFISGNLDVSGSLQLQGGSLNFTGSLTVVDGFDLSVNGHKQFNYAFVTSSLDQSGSGTPQAFTGLSIVNGKGITIESGSRVKVTNAGVYKFDAQLQAYTTGDTQLLTRWYKNGTLQQYFEQDSFLRANQFTVVPTSMLFDLNANDYIEVYWGGISGGANSGSIQLKQESRFIDFGVQSYVMPGRIFVSQVS